MKAVRLHQYEELPKVEEVSEPKMTGPHDVIVRIGGAGLCRTDLHIVEGQWREKSGGTFPHTLGPENAGWVHAVGPPLHHVAGRRAVLVHPPVTCGLSPPSPAGNPTPAPPSSF